MRSAASSRLLCLAAAPAPRRYLLNSIEWLDEALDNFGEDDYLLIDCPGQIELYSHLPVMRTLASHLQKKGFKAVGVYLMDALFVTDHAKMLAGNLAALSAMVAMELPHVNVREPPLLPPPPPSQTNGRHHTVTSTPLQVLTKCDLVQQDLSAYLLPSGQELAASLSEHTPPKFRGLNTAFGRLVCAAAAISTPRFVMFRVVCSWMTTTWCRLCLWTPRTKTALGTP